MHEMKLREVYFDLVKNGKKIYEIRLNDEKRQLLKIGDKILFKKQDNQDQCLLTIVKDLIYFESFAEMIKNLPTDQIGFVNTDNNSLENVYHNFYSIEEEKKYGVVAIRISVVH